MKKTTDASKDKKLKFVKETIVNLTADQLDKTRGGCTMGCTWISNR